MSVMLVCLREAPVKYEQRSGVLFFLPCVIHDDTYAYMYARSYITQLEHLTELKERRALIRAISEVVGARDPYTGAHNGRVGELSGLIAQRLGCSPAEVTHIAECGALHDVGKLGLPLSSIRKPGALSVEEYDEVKRHPEMGVEVLRLFPTLQDLTQGVLYHHERFDGAGYPFGLKGDDIPLSARVVAAADTIDAMMSDRSYRSALTWSHVRAELNRAAEGQLDPRVIQAALPLCS